MGSNLIFSSFCTSAGFDASYSIYFLTFFFSSFLAYFLFFLSVFTYSIPPSDYQITL